MIYLIKKTRLTFIAEESTMQTDRRNDYVEAGSAVDALADFLRVKRELRSIGEIESLPGDAAVTSCLGGERNITYVIRAVPMGSDEVARKLLNPPASPRRRQTDRP